MPRPDKKAPIPNSSNDGEREIEGVEEKNEMLKPMPRTRDDETKDYETKDYETMTTIKSATMTCEPVFHIRQLSPCPSHHTVLEIRNPWGLEGTLELLTLDAEGRVLDQRSRPLARSLDSTYSVHQARLMARVSIDGSEFVAEVPEGERRMLGLTRKPFRAEAGSR